MRFVFCRYKSQSHEGTRQTNATFYLLLDLMSFFEQYHRQQYDSALDIIQQLQLLPFTHTTVEQKVTAFKYYADEVSYSI